MSGNTMSFALPRSMREYIDERVRSGHYGNTSEYLRDLIRKDQEAQSRQHLRVLIAEGLDSGDGRPFTDDVQAELRTKALARCHGYQLLSTSSHAAVRDGSG